jgi:16S rRNA (cytosine967-C5)-methyltransferase
MLAAPALDPQPGEIVADVGAAPGGKTTHLAERMRDEGTVLAIEPHAGRLALIAENSRRLGLTSIRPVASSGFDAVGQPVERALVDAPCSGLGTLYRKADLRWRATPQDADALVDLQSKLLAAVAEAVRPGGAIVYATCTTRAAENQGVASRFLAAHPEFQAGDLRHALPPGWHADAAGGMIQLLPHCHGTEGFFLARFNRR